MKKGVDPTSVVAMMKLKMVLTCRRSCSRKAEGCAVQLEEEVASFLDVYGNLSSHNTDVKKYTS